MTTCVRPPRYVSYRPHSLRRVAGVLAGEIGDLSAPCDVRWVGHRATRIHPPPHDTLLTALGADASLRAAVYDATLAFANQTMCNWTEKMDVHLTVTKFRDGEANWEYLDVSSDSAGRIWIEETGAKRDRAEYWLSLASLSMLGVDVRHTVMDEQDWDFVRGSDVASWFAPPDRKGGQYVQAMKAVSSRVQEAVRKVARWWLLDDRNLGSGDLVDAMLMFSALPVRAGRTGATMVPDALGARFGLPVRGLLTRLRQHMEDLFLDLPAERYHPSNAQRVYDAVERRPQHLRRLIAEQANIVETLFHLAEGGRDCRDMLRADRTGAMRQAAKLSAKISSDLHVKMRRFAAEVPAPRSAPLVLVAASCGLTDVADCQNADLHRYSLGEKKAAA